MIDPETKSIIEETSKDIEELRQILFQKGAEKGTRILLEQINKEFINSLISINDNLNQTISTLKIIAEESKIDKKEILGAIKEIKLEPKIDIFPPKVEIPEIRIPKIEIPPIKIPTPQVTVNPPDIHIPEIKIPKEIKVTGFASFIEALFSILKSKLNVVLGEINRNNPLPVILTDDEGVFYKALTKMNTLVGGGGGSGIRIIKIVDSDNNYVDFATSAKQAPYALIGSGTATVTTARSEIQLTSASCKRIFIQAHESNTGTIVVGDSNVVAALVGRRGRAFFSTQGDWFLVNNLALLYIDSTADGDKINYYYEN